MDLLWMFEEDVNGVLEEKYTATTEEMAEAIQQELSFFLEEAENLIAKVNLPNPKIVRVMIERPDTIFLELRL